MWAEASQTSPRNCASQGRGISFDDWGPHNRKAESCPDDLGERLEGLMGTVGVAEADDKGLRVLWQMALVINLLEKAPMTEIIRVLQGICG